MMDTPSWPSILTRLNEIDDVWNLFDAANATNAVRATVRTGGPYARLFMRGASYALFTVGGRDVVCEASLQYQNADASSFLLMILRQRFDEYGTSLMNICIRPLHISTQKNIRLQTTTNNILKMASNSTSAGTDAGTVPAVSPGVIQLEDDEEEPEFYVVADILNELLHSEDPGRV